MGNEAYLPAPPLTRPPVRRENVATITTSRTSFQISAPHGTGLSRIKSPHFLTLLISSCFNLPRRISIGSRGLRRFVV